jgi:hypothetical protein
MMPEPRPLVPGAGSWGMTTGRRLPVVVRVEQGHPRAAAPEHDVVRDLAERVERQVVHLKLDAVAAERGPLADARSGIPLPHDQLELPRPLGEHGLVAERSDAGPQQVGLHGELPGMIRPHDRERVRAADAPAGAEDDAGRRPWRLLPLPNDQSRGAGAVAQNAFVVRGAHARSGEPSPDHQGPGSLASRT